MLVLDARGLTIAATIALVMPLTHSRSDASTRGRVGAETVLNDPPARISAGMFHTCQVKDDGTVRCWGNNSSGALGDGTTTRRLDPVAVIGITNAIAVGAGNGHACALLADGTARCWGFNVMVSSATAPPCLESRRWRPHPLL